MDTFTPNFGRMERNEVLGLQFRMEAILFLSFPWILVGRPAPFLCWRVFFLSDKG